MMLLKNSFRLLVCVSLAAGIISAYAWSSQPIRCQQNIRGVISPHQQQSLLSADVTHNYKNRNNVLLSVALAISIITVTTTTTPCIVVADDYESPTIFTGETVMVRYYLGLRYVNPLRYVVPFFKKKRIKRLIVFFFLFVYFSLDLYQAWL